MSAPSWLPFAAWPTLGALAGVTFGLALTAPVDARAAIAPFLGIAALVGAAGLIVTYSRRRLRARRAAPTRRPGTPAARTPDAGTEPAKPTLTARVEFPAIPDTAPGAPADGAAPTSPWGEHVDVWGVGEALPVRVVAREDGRPAAGASVSVRVTSGGSSRALADARVGADGALETPLVVAEPAEVTLEATVRASGAVASAKRALRVVRYEVEVQELFDGFREWAHTHVAGCEDALTAREVTDVLTARAGRDGARALAEVARVYEIVAYGERPADRDLYLALLGAFEDADEAGVFARYEPAAPEGAAGGR